MTITEGATTLCSIGSNTGGLAGEAQSELDEGVLRADCFVASLPRLLCLSLESEYFIKNAFCVTYFFHVPFLC